MGYGGLFTLFLALLRKSLYYNDLRNIVFVGLKLGLHWPPLGLPSYNITPLSFFVNIW
jgi:hypothetical protein